MFSRHIIIVSIYVMYVPLSIVLSTEDFARSTYTTTTSNFAFISAKHQRSHFPTLLSNSGSRYQQNDKMVLNSLMKEVSHSSKAKEKLHGMAQSKSSGVGNTPITRTCSNCTIQKDRNSFFKKKWVAAGKGHAEGKCKECTKFDELKLKTCCICNEQKARSEFSKKQWSKIEPSCKECLLQRSNNFAELQRIRKEAKAARHANYGKKRSHDAEIADPSKKPRLLHTSQDEKAATESNANDIEAPQKAVPDKVLSGAAAAPGGTATTAASAVAGGRGIDNRPAWLTQGLHSASAAFSAPTSNRGRGRGVDNRPAWMTRGRPPSASVALSSSVQEERGVHNMTQSFATIDMPIEIHQQIGAAQAAAVNSAIARFGGRGRGVDNRPAWMTRSQFPVVEVRVKHEVYVTHKVDIHTHHATDIANQEEPIPLRVKEEYY